jgi:hypothetical protein
MGSRGKSLLEVSITVDFTVYTWLQQALRTFFQPCPGSKRFVGRVPLGKRRPWKNRGPGFKNGAATKGKSEFKSGI